MCTVHYVWLSLMFSICIACYAAVRVERRRLKPVLVDAGRSRSRPAPFLGDRAEMRGSPRQPGAARTARRPAASKEVGVRFGFSPVLCCF